MEPHPASVPASGDATGLRGLIQAGILYFEARARLFQIEASEAGQLLSRLVVLAVLAFALSGGAWLLLMPVIVWAVAHFAGCSWQVAAGVIGGLHLVTGFLLALRVKSAAARLKLFEETINQCRRDRECLGTNHPEGN